MRTAHLQCFQRGKTIEYPCGQRSQPVLTQVPVGVGVWFNDTTRATKGVWDRSPWLKCDDTVHEIKVGAALWVGQGVVGHLPSIGRSRHGTECSSTYDEHPQKFRSPFNPTAAKSERRREGCDPSQTQGAKCPHNPVLVAPAVSSFTMPRV